MPGAQCVRMRLPEKVKHQRGCCPRVASSAATASAFPIEVEVVTEDTRSLLARFSQAQRVGDHRDG